MEKRYQVFISSTFRDLVQERQEVLKAVLEIDHMPAGMELFPAADDAAWQLIKDVIDGSDHYVVIIGGRYGPWTTPASDTRRRNTTTLRVRRSPSSLCCTRIRTIFPVTRRRPTRHPGRS